MSDPKYSTEVVANSIKHLKDGRYTQVWPTKLLGEIIGNDQLDCVLWAAQKYQKWGYMINQLEESEREKFEGRQQEKTEMKGNNP